MDGEGGFGTYAEGCAVLVRAGAQVGDAAQEFVGMALLLQGVRLCVGCAEKGQRLYTYLPLLALSGRLDQLTGDVHGGTRADGTDVRIGGNAFIHDGLYVRKA